MGRETRSKLINTAHDLIWCSSYGGVSVDDICKAAEVKKGSFYHFFGSKSELTIATIKHYFEERRAQIDGIFSPSRAPLERFKLLVKIVCERQREMQEKYHMVCGCPIASLGCEVAGQDENIRRAVAEMVAVYCRYYESALRDLVVQGLIPSDTDIELKAQEISRFMMGEMTMARIQNSLEQLENNLEQRLLRVVGVAEVEPATI